MDLSEKLNNIPSGPGVYQMKDGSGTIIYVGKAVNLRSRVRSYFNNDPKDRKTRVMVKKVRDIDIIVTDSEVEALVLEQNLIKEHQPRYNINLKDDKRYPFIKITNEPFPRIFVTRQKQKDGARYFGPYTNVRDLRHIMDTLDRMFPTRRCKKVLPTDKPEKSCLYYQIHRCPGVCSGRISQAAYAETIRTIRLYLSGKMNEVVNALQQQMKKAAQETRYEDAARYRDQIAEFESVGTRQKVFAMEEIDRDIFALVRRDTDAVGLVLQVRTGKLVGSRHFLLTHTEEQTDAALVSSFLKQYYIDSDFVPRQIYLPMDVDSEDRDTVVAWLEKVRPGKVDIIIPRKGEKHKLLELAARNAELLLQEVAQQREKARGQVPYNVETLRKDLNLKKPPRLIEAIDISNISGTDAVGSVVTFKDGRPFKSGYRRFKIQVGGGPDDYRMIREVVNRRYRRLREEQAVLPDLVLIDGGKGQLSSAQEELKQLKLDQLPVVGLAKKLEEVFLPGLSNPQNIPKHSSGLKLLQAIRDEAHRFAITYHKSLREKRTIASELDQVPGVGEKSRQALLKRFGSVAKVKAASAEEIAQTEGIGKKLAENIFKWFHKNYNGNANQ